MLTKILPDSLLADEKFRAVAAALDNILKQLSADTKSVIFLPRLDEITNSKVLDLLAYQLHADYYEPLHLTDDVKKKIIRDSVDLHRKRGTAYAVKKALADFDFISRVVEWYECGGNPYTFRIYCQPFTEQINFDSFLRVLFTEKNVRSLPEIWIEKKAEQELFIGHAHLLEGKETITTRQDALVTFHALAGYQHGKVSIDFDTKKEPYDVFAAHVHYLRGRVTIKPEFDNNMFICHGIAGYQHGRVTIGTDTFNYRQNIFAGIIACAGGKITIDAETAEEELNIFSGIAQALRGKITVDSDDGLIIVPSDNNQLTIYFNFDSGQRQLTLNNPREDLTEQDIQDVGNFAAQKGLLINSSGETVTGTSKFALIESDKPRLWTQRRINRYFRY